MRKTYDTLYRNVSDLQDQMDRIRTEIVAIKDVVEDLEKTIHGESKLEKAAFPLTWAAFTARSDALVPGIKKTNRRVEELTENLGLLMERLNLQFVDLPAERTIVSDEETE